MNIRELLLGRRRFKYRILFVIRSNAVTILRVWHTSRDSITRNDLPDRKSGDTRTLSIADPMNWDSE